MRALDDTERPLRKGERCRLMCEAPRDPASPDLFVDVVDGPLARVEGLTGPWYSVQPTWSTWRGGAVLARRSALEALP